LIGFVAGENPQEDEPIPGPSNQYDVDAPIGQTNQSEEIVGGLLVDPDALTGEYFFLYSVL
jgi:hypothetical protein